MRNSTKQKVLLGFVLAALAVNVQATEIYCGYDPEIDGVFEYPFANKSGTTEINAKFILVAFPTAEGNSYEIPNSFAYDTYHPIITKMDDLLREQSHGKLKLSANSSFVFPHETGWTESDPNAESWMADLPARRYNNADTNFVGEEYKDSWSVDGHNVSGWWTTESQYATHLFAELFWKINSDYTNPSDPAPNPFSEPVDYLFFIFATTETPYKLSPDGVGGRPHVTVNYEAVLEDTGDFFSQLSLIIPPRQSSTEFRGTGQTGSGQDRTLRTIMHELGHAFGFLEGPPALHWSSYHEDEAAYFYGNLNTMNQHWVNTQATPAFGLHWTNTLDWVETVDFTGKNLKGVRLYDLRVFDQEGPDLPRGQVYKFKPEGSDQYFLMAYRSGMGIDSRVRGEEAILRSHGLEIYHCVGDEGSPVVVDLESAFGLYSNITSDSLPLNPLILPPASWGTPDPLLGFDNYDKWTVGDSLRANYPDYVGDEFDFFRIDLKDDSSIWNKANFSFASNPNCYWYEATPPLDRWTRRDAQSVENSMVIRILEQYDSDVVEHPYMVVDFLSAPYEEITGCALDETGDDGDNIVITYSNTPEWAEVFTSFDVFFCPTQNRELLIPVESDVDFDQPDNSYSFPVLNNYGTPEGGGLVVVKFHNNLTDYTGDEYSDPIYINLPPVVYENLLLPSDDDHLFIRSNCRVECTAGFAPELIDSKQVQYENDNGWVDLELAGSGWALDAETNRNYCSFIVPEGMKGTNVSMRLVFTDNDDNVVEGDPITGIKVFSGAVYDDISTGALENIESYSGTPASIVPISLSGSSGGTSVILSLPADGGQENGAVFEYFSDPSGVKFQKLDSQDFSGLPFEAGLSSFAVADFDGDGDDDYFACNDSIGPSVLFIKNGDGLFEGVGLSLGNSGNPVNFPNKTQSATWVDYDHDGDLDLFLGRYVSNDVELTENKLFKYDSTEGYFTEVRDAAGLAGINGAYSANTVCWADLDWDGYWEVILSVGAGGILVFEENDRHSFVLNPGPFPFTDIDATSLTLQDFNSDGELDLVVGEYQENHLQIFFMDSGEFSAGNSFMLKTPFIPNQISSGDMDRDGWMDLLVTSGFNNGGFQMYRNMMGEPEYGEVFVNSSPGSGFPKVGNVKGASLVDFGLNGAWGIFSGKEHNGNGGVVWEAQTVTPEPSWLGIKLQQYNGIPSCGAIVSLSNDTEVLGVQVYGGNSGSGSQGTNGLVFGLGDAPGPYKAKIIWPGHVTSSETNLATNQYHIVDQPTIWLMDSQSPSLEVVIRTNQIDWVFTWETENLTPAEDDWVDFTPIQNCGTLTGDQLVPGTTPGVSTSLNYSCDPVTGLVTYLHTLVYEDAPCVPGCSISFTVHGGNSDIGIQTAGPTTGRFPKLCPVSTGN